MTTSIPLAAILILLLILAALTARSSRRATPVEPDHHHWITRLLCAGLGVAALTAVGVGTWHGTKAHAASPHVTVPTKPPRPIDPTKNTRDIDFGPSKLIGTVLVVRKLQDRFLPVCGESLTCEWPPRPDSALVFHGAHGGATYTITMHVGEFSQSGNDGVIMANNGLSIETNGPTWSSRGSGSLELNCQQINYLGFGPASIYRAPLSLIPSSIGQDLRLLIHLTRADHDDPLREIPAAQWLDSHAADRRLDHDQMNSYPGVLANRKVAPGIRMLAFLGPSTVLLLVAAIAGAHLFRHGRRAYAFTILLALMVLYAGLLDALVLQRRLRVVADSNQTEAVRTMALADLSHCTFFHSGTASSRIRAIAADAAAPEFLRQFSRALTLDSRR